MGGTYWIGGNLPRKNATWRRLSVLSTNTETILWRGKEKHLTSTGSTLKGRILPTMVVSRRRSGHTTELQRSTVLNPSYLASPTAPDSIWISGARVWCNARRPASLKNQILT